MSICMDDYSYQWDNEYVGFSWRKQQNGDDRYTMHDGSVSILLYFLLSHII